MKYWEPLYADWENKRFANVYFFHGEEEYIKRASLEKLRSCLLEKGRETLDETRLEGSVSAARIIEAVETLPLSLFSMDEPSGRRLVIVNDYAPLVSGRVKDMEENLSRLAEWIPNAPDSCTLVFYTHGRIEGKASSAKPKAGKKPEAKKSARSAYEILQPYEALFPYLDDATLGTFLRGHAKKNGATIGAEACDALVTICGRDCTRLLTEIGKLASMAQGGEIGVELVERSVARTPESTVFQLIDDLTAGKYVQAQEKKQSLLNNGQKQGYILYMITRQIRLLCLARECLDRKATESEAMEVLKTSPYAVRNLLGQARRLKTESVRRVYEMCVEAEYSFKSGRTRDEDELERVMLVLNAEMRK